MTEADKALIKKLANMGWEINGDRLETSRSFNRSEATALTAEFNPINNRVGLQATPFNDERKLSMDKKKAVRFFTEHDVQIMLTDPAARLDPPGQSRRSR